MAEDGFVHLVLLFKLSGSAAQATSISPPRAQSLSRLFLRPSAPDACDDNPADNVNLAWKA